MKRDDLAKELCGVAEYYEKKLPKPIIELYWKGLRHLTLEQLKRALWSHIENPERGHFFPKISDLAAASAREPYDAWQELVEAVEKVGPYRSVVFSDKAIGAAVLALGGWVKLGSIDLNEWLSLTSSFANFFHSDSIPMLSYTPPSVK